MGGGGVVTADNPHQIFTPGRQVLVLPDDATWPEVCQATVRLARAGGSRLPLALCKAVQRVELRDGGGASEPMLDELRRRFGASPYDEGTEGEVIEWLRSR